uniref:Uncharacterized protein n=1 Tax=Hyaloperonospora arabidopsidis (strain Emoy2) TaxID=559515 RepID=M4C1J7_HYAAE
MRDYSCLIQFFCLSVCLSVPCRHAMTFVHPEHRLSAYALYDIGVLLPRLHHLLLAGLVCLARLFGHHGGHFAEGTWNRISSPGADRALKSQETPGTRPITPDGPLTHLD